MNLNKAIIIGNVTQDPEVRTTPGGAQVANFTVATNRTWNDRSSGEKQTKAEFHNVVAWSRLAEIISQYVKRGTLIMIEGRIETRSWEDTNGGGKKYRTEIIAENMQLGPRGGGGDGASSGNSAFESSRPSRQAPQNSANEEELPTIDASSPSDDEVDIKDIPF
ncbi:MAG: single-stranded DNA-binding protein [Candidatus Spechtbacterales bacterium]